MKIKIPKKQIATRTLAHKRNPIFCHVHKFCVLFAFAPHKGGRRKLRVQHAGAPVRVAVLAHVLVLLGHAGRTLVLVPVEATGVQVLVGLVLVLVLEGVPVHFVNVHKGALGPWPVLVLAGAPVGFGPTHQGTLVLVPVHAGVPAHVVSVHEGTPNPALVLVHAGAPPGPTPRLTQSC